MRSTLSISPCAQTDQPYFRLIHAEMKQRVIQLAIGLQWPVSIAELFNLNQIIRDSLIRPAQRQVSITMIAIQSQTDVLVFPYIVVLSLLRGDSE